MKKKIQPKAEYIKAPDGKRIAYRRFVGKKNLPGIIFCGGFLSDMTGVKAMAIAAFCRKNGISLINFDYTGHGISDGKFEEGTIGRWRDDALLVLDKLTKGKQIIIGSSMGGWIGLLMARARPKRIGALIGIAAAPDFTEYLLWDKLDKKTQDEIRTKGKKYFESDFDSKSGCSSYAITWKLIEDGRKNMLLHKKIAIDCPVRLIHGMDDEDVPYETSLRIAEKLTGKDVRIILQKEGNHRMSEPDDIELILATIEELLER